MQDVAAVVCCWCSAFEVPMMGSTSESTLSARLRHGRSGLRELRPTTEAGDSAHPEPSVDVGRLAADVNYHATKRGIGLKLT